MTNSVISSSISSAKLEICKVIIPSSSNMGIRDAVLRACFNLVDVYITKGIADFSTVYVVRVGIDGTTCIPIAIYKLPTKVSRSLNTKRLQNFFYKELGVNFSADRLKSFVKSFLGFGLIEVVEPNTPLEDVCAIIKSVDCSPTSLDIQL